VRFLVDPMLSERHFWPDFGGRANSEKRSPLVHPAIPVENALNVDAVIGKA
jgi:L-ascorbate metabolism protein UlaG (beta-lactamase superfamily)